MSVPEQALEDFTTRRDPRLRLLIPFIVAVAFLMESLDSTAITTAVPAMAKSLGVTPVEMSLAVSSYVLSVAVFIPVSGWFADRFGARQIFAVALLVFTLGSALCGMAENFPMLVAMRIVQGMGGAMMTPVGRLILLRSFPRSELIRSMTYLTLPALAGPVIGPLIGGMLTTYLSWRWIFYVNLPIGLLGILLALRFVEDVRGAAVARFDFPGFLMVGSGLALLQFGMQNVSQPVLTATEIAGMIAAGLALLLGFGLYVRHAEAPAVDLTLFRLRFFAVGTVAGGFCRIALNGTPFLLPLMLQLGFGMSPISSGWFTSASVAGILVMRAGSPRLLRRFGFGRVLIASTILSSLALAGFALLTPTTPYWLLLLYVFAFELVRSTQFMISNTLAYSDMPAERLSRATSLGGVLQQLSVSFGVSMGAMLLSFVAGHGHALTPALFHKVFLLSAVLPLMALPGFMRLKPEDGVQVSGYRRA